MIQLALIKLSNFRAEEYETILFSGGKVGSQVEVALSDLSQILRYTVADITKDSE